MRRQFLKSALFVTAVAFAGSALAEPFAPNKPIRMVLGYPAGSGIDNVARQIAQHMEKTIGQVVYVENKPGALGNIAAQNVATSAPDGYSILFTPNSAPVANVHLFKKLPFDPVKDFTPVAPVATLGFVVLVNPQLPVNTMGELTALLKKDPGKYSYGTGNATGQVAGALYTSMANVSALNVPYKGVPPAVTDLIGGRLDFVMADASLAIPQLKGGRVKALAVTNATRPSALKDVPTMAESGLPGFDLTGWFGIFLPAKASPEIVKFFEKHIALAVNDPVLSEQFRSIGVEPLPGTPSDLARMVSTDTAKWGRIIKQAGIVAE